MHILSHFSSTIVFWLFYFTNLHIATKPIRRKVKSKHKRTKCNLTDPNRCPLLSAAVFQLDHRGHPIPGHSKLRQPLGWPQDQALFPRKRRGVHPQQANEETRGYVLGRYFILSSFSSHNRIRSGKSAFLLHCKKIIIISIFVFVPIKYF